MAPFYESIKQFLPVLGEHVVRFEENKGIWKEQVEKYEEELSRECVNNE